MNLSGSTIRFPFVTDNRGTMKTVSNKSDLIAQEIAEVIQTRKGSRVMMPDFGLSDSIFAVANIGFELRLKIEIETQITVCSAHSSRAGYDSKRWRRSHYRKYTLHGTRRISVAEKLGLSDLATADWRLIECQLYIHN
jgi:hypothetical protein